MTVNSSSTASTLASCAYRTEGFAETRSRRFRQIGFAERVTTSYAKTPTAHQMLNSSYLMRRKKGIVDTTVQASMNHAPIPGRTILTVLTSVQKKLAASHSYVKKPPWTVALAKKTRDAHRWNQLIRSYEVPSSRPIGLTRTASRNGSEVCVAVIHAARNAMRSWKLASCLMDLVKLEITLYKIVRRSRISIGQDEMDGGILLKWAQPPKVETGIDHN
ncbi:hypothetical protein HG530_002694 [Fusarium avenaceum]|nr:hypothetical protein HG530_002694 [Fusarium avenaceum]